MLIASYNATRPGLQGLLRPGDTPELLWRRDLAPLGLQLLGQVLGDAEAGKVTKVPQDATLATWEPAFTTGKSLATI